MTINHSVFRVRDEFANFVDHDIKGDIAAISRTPERVRRTKRTNTIPRLSQEATKELKTVQVKRVYLRYENISVHLSKEATLENLLRNVSKLDIIEYMVAKEKVPFANEEEHGSSYVMHVYLYMKTTFDKITNFDICSTTDKRKDTKVSHPIIFGVRKVMILKQFLLGVDGDLLTNSTDFSHNPYTYLGPTKRAGALFKEYGIEQVLSTNNLYLLKCYADTVLSGRMEYALYIHGKTAYYKAPVLLSYLNACGLDVIHINALEQIHDIDLNMIKRPAVIVFDHISGRTFGPNYKRAFDVRYDGVVRYKGAETYIDYNIGKIVITNLPYHEWVVQPYCAYIELSNLWWDFIEADKIKDLFPMPQKVFTHLLPPEEQRLTPKFNFMPKQKKSGSTSLALENSSLEQELKILSETSFDFVSKPNFNAKKAKLNEWNVLYDVFGMLPWQLVKNR